MTAKVFPEGSFIPPTANQNNKLLSNNGKTLFWTSLPFDNGAFFRDGNASSTSVLELAALPRCNTFELHFYSTSSMSTSSLTFNGDGQNNYTQNWDSTNGSGSSSENGAPTTLTSSISLSNAFSNTNPVYYIRINGAGGSGLKTAQIHWQDAAGNGLAMGSWRGSSPINRMNFSFGSTVNLTYRIVGY